MRLPRQEVQGSACRFSSAISSISPEWPSATGTEWRSAATFFMTIMASFAFSSALAIARAAAMAAPVALASGILRCVAGYGAGLGVALGVAAIETKSGPVL